MEDWSDCTYRLIWVFVMHTSEGRFSYIAAPTKKCIIWPMPREKEVFVADLGSATDKSRIHIYFYFFMKVNSCYLDFAYLK